MAALGDLPDGNPSSPHTEGRAARAALDRARDLAARALGEDRTEVSFTGSGTESVNLALFGVAHRLSKRASIVTWATEHQSVLGAVRRLQAEGHSVDIAKVDRFGRADPDGISSSAGLVSIGLANNEVGTIQPIGEIGAITRKRGVLFHCDAVQGFGKTPFDVKSMNVDLASLTAHKIYGPKGVGALYVRRKSPRVQITAQMDGGGHERGMRSGTLNVPGIVGMGESCAICHREMPEESKRLSHLRDKLRNTFETELDEVFINGSMEHRLPHNLNMSFAYVEGESLLMGINDVAVSSGSACTSATLEPSYVLKALGVGDDLAHTSIRFGLGRFNTEEEVDYVAGRVIEVVRKLRELSPLYEMAKEGVDFSKVQWAAE